MFSTLNTLLKGSQARTNDRMRDHFAIDLIDQKIREADGSLKAAKTTLASLILRHRTEGKQIEALDKRIIDLTSRAKAAIEDGREDMATEAACAIAQMENESTLRCGTANRLDTKITRLRHSVDTAHRRIIDLKQSAVTAKAVQAEQKMQARLAPGIETSFEEAEELIARVMSRDDPFEHGEVLRDINADLKHENIADKLAGEGFGPAIKSTTADVLARLKSN
ncbi:MAG: PspA/IM30 family protein [Rhodobacteraceae bacterium]|nr:PspA/IM30 family protein [Paracoccaceae bacterium]